MFYQYKHFYKSSIIHKKIIIKLMLNLEILIIIYFKKINIQYHFNYF